MRRWRGLKSLVIDAVEHGSRAVEHIQLETARLPYAILEQVPPLTAPVRGIRAIHETSVKTTHEIIRLVTRAVGDTLDVVLDVVEERRAAASADGDREGRKG